MPCKAFMAFTKIIQIYFIQIYFKGHVIEVGLSNKKNMTKRSKSMTAAKLI